MLKKPEAVFKDKVVKPEVTTLTGPRRAEIGHNVIAGPEGKFFRVFYEPYGWGNGMGVRPRFVEQPALFDRRLGDAEMDEMPIERHEGNGCTIQNK